MNYSPSYVRPRAIICDLDGTLCNLARSNGERRKPYGEAQADCINDGLREDVLEQIDEYLATDSSAFLLLVSGRFDTYLSQTKQWLRENYIAYDALFLRSAEDMREDQVIKRELYEQEIAPYYDVVLVFDDRPKVIRMWQELGLNVVDVGDGVEF